MTNYNEYRAEEDARRITKQINCLHDAKVTLTMRCDKCKRINTIKVNRDELCPSVVDCLCISGKNLPY
jgi:hypothetical protein